MTDWTPQIEIRRSAVSLHMQVGLDAGNNADSTPKISPLPSTEASFKLPSISLSARGATQHDSSTLDSTARGAMTERSPTRKWRKSLQAVKARVSPPKQERRSRVEMELRERALRARGAIRRARVRQDWAHSERALTEALSLQPDDEQLLLERSTVLLRQRKIDQSLADAQQLVSINPASARGHAQVGVGLTYRHQYSEAAQALVQALDIDPTDVGSSSLLDEVVHTIRRRRSYWQSPTAASKPNRLFDKRIEADAPPLTATQPAQCQPPRATPLSHNSMRIAWVLVDDDGGDEVFQYEVQYAPVDPITQEPAGWRTAYLGVRKLGVQLSDLLPDTEYLFKVQATNTVGPSIWSEYGRGRTEPLPEGFRRAITDIPESWHGLQYKLDDAFRRIAPEASSYDQLWAEAVTVLRRHVGVLKQCFRIYTLLGVIDDNPVDISMFQYRRMLNDLQLSGAQYPSADMNNIFIKTNSVDAAGTPNISPSDKASDRATSVAATSPGLSAPSPSSVIDGGLSVAVPSEEQPLVGAADSEGQLSTIAKSEKNLSQHRFVGAMIRIAALRARNLQTEGGRTGSLGKAIDELVTEHIIPFADLAIGDEVSELLRERTVRWILEKNRDKMAFPFAVYSTIDDEGSVLLMNLREMLALFRDSGVIDEHALSQYAATKIFAIVNLSDELFEAMGGVNASNNSAELTLDEFMEVIGRMCHARLAAVPPPEGQKFEETLECWFDEFLVEALTTAAKQKVEEEKAASPAKNKRMMKRLKGLKKTFEASITEDEQATTFYSDPNAKVADRQ